ncbi:alpha beta-hydrolase [Pyrrhoderma noxium]|uniref:Alpha beta-hydrolase n=1 Tax=Pyrrhoderma noxium TaxID=2282107 RepID=A0A286UE55_9AGAM|nr:alpha beta-hydrolase [Pyrrhoderma noxium]
MTLSTFIQPPPSLSSPPAFYPSSSSLPAGRRQLLPLLDPPRSKFPNPLPSLPHESAERVRSIRTTRNNDTDTNNIPQTKTDLNIPGFALSTHLIPAAYPRTLPYVPIPESASTYLTLKDKAERRKAVEKLTKEVIETRVQVGEGNDSDDKVSRGYEDAIDKDGGQNQRLLWNCVNRYYRTTPPPSKKAKPLTLLLTHANGLHKETWEPFLRYLTSITPEEYYIEEAWALEAVQHGDSALVNGNNLGLVYDWVDNSRDIINFLTRYLPSGTTTANSDSESFPIHLPRISQSETDTRINHGFGDRRTLISIGHSFGGCTALLAALSYPALFHSIVPVDPVVVPPRTDRVKEILNFVVGALGRRNQWKDRDEALASLRTSRAFFGRWDPEVLELYVRCGMVSSADQKSVELKMPGLQEAVVFADGRSGIVSREAYIQLAELDPKVRLHWVMAGVGHPLAGDAEAVREVVWRRPVNSSNRVIERSAHLIVQEAPRELALEVRTFLDGTFGNKFVGEKDGFSEGKLLARL